MQLVLGEALVQVVVGRILLHANEKKGGLDPLDGNVDVGDGAQDDLRQSRVSALIVDNSTCKNSNQAG